jgi:hypothetical protein
MTKSKTGRDKATSSVPRMPKKKTEPSTRTRSSPRTQDMTEHDDGTAFGIVGAPPNNPTGSPSTVMKYQYYDYENNIYRKAADDSTWIQEVKTPDGWKPYRGGDPLAPRWYGYEITAEEAGEKE